MEIERVTQDIVRRLTATLSLPAKQRDLAEDIVRDQLIREVTHATH